MKDISFLIKPASSVCDLRCGYCFYEEIAQHRAVCNRGKMSEDTVRLLLEQAYSLTEPGATVQFAFQGGEPTLAGLDFFRFFTKQAKELCPQNVQLRFSIQTNGMLLNEAWTCFFREEQFLVGLSLDGCKELHDQYRVDVQGKGTWNRVCKSLQLLQKQQVEHNVLCVVTRACARSPEKVYQTLKRLGVRYMQFIPCLDPMDGERGSAEFSLTPKAYGAFLCRLFDLWFADWQEGRYHSIRLFEEYVNLLLGERNVTCSTCGRCGGYFVTESDGSIYPCDFFVLDAWEMGRLGETTLAQMAQGETAARFLAQSEQKPTACGTCRWRALCNGGCKKDWQQGEKGTRNYFCEAFQTFFSHAEQRLLVVARAEARARRKAAF